MFREKKKLRKALEKTNRKLEAIKINEYVDLMSDTKKLLWKNFLSGISKGIGSAIGFSILGAIVLLILRKVVLLNIPLLGKYLKDILEIVEAGN